SLAWVRATAGLSCLDISTGAFRVTESDDVREIVNEALRMAPKEALVPESARTDPRFSALLDALPETAFTFLEDKSFNPRPGRTALLDQFKTLSLEGFGCEQMTAGIGAAGALLEYVRETQKQRIEHLPGIETYSLGDYLLMDDLSFRNLELIRNIRTGSKQGTLLAVIDRTHTAMGARLLNQWVRHPLVDKKRILARQEAVADAGKKLQVRQRLRENLKTVHDLERLGSRISMGRANARDLLALKNSLLALPGIRDALSRLKAKHFKWRKEADDLQELAALLESAIREDAPPTITDGGLIKPGYNEELDELITISRDGKGWLARLEAREKKSLGVHSLKVRFNKVFGYYIEIPKRRAESVPDAYVRKQTLVNAERFITDELKDFENKVLGAEDRRASLEHRLFNELRKEVHGHYKTIRETARFVARVDCLLTLAEIADQNNYNRPEINTEGVIHIEDGRHPVVEKMITGERFVPNSIHMDNQENQMLIITGPNMAGKSTVLRQIALLTLMTQVGSFIPASKASICVTDRIFTRVGALDNLSQGQSTFMVEMQETANILHNATPDSLVIMDEIGRGTSTYDGLSIAWAVAEHLHDLKGAGVKSLFATHYHELTELARHKPRVRNFNIAVKEWNEEIIFLRKLVSGGTNRSYGVQVARLAGIPDPVIRRAKKILRDIELGQTGAGAAIQTPGAEKKSKKKKPVQLELFRDPGGVVMEKINKIDIASLTPLEALNVLSDLQQTAASTV
ncbi:MAG: DNA mismatch repair protein MutS, partial [Desulfobacterales bacterium]|nr:DNA mismatch repair protein MutS [Desulfobacterales bacterium]